MNIEEIEELTDLLFENGYDMLKTINESNKKVKAKDKEIKILKEKNKELKSYMQDTYDSFNDMCSELQQRIDKALDYLDKNSFGLGYVEVAKLADMLRGDKE